MNAEPPGVAVAAGSGATKAAAVGAFEPAPGTPLLHCALFAPGSALAISEDVAFAEGFTAPPDAWALAGGEGVEAALAGTASPAGLGGVTAVNPAG